MIVLPVKDSVVEYDETSSTFLRWRVDILSGKNKPQVKKGDEAGCLHSSSKSTRYYSFQYKGKKYLNHRVIYTIMCGEIPDEMVVDHKDGNPFNNSPANLRLVSIRHNSQNRYKRDVNSSGITGVSFKSQEGRNGAVASWKNIDHSQGSKYFSVEMYGLMPAFKMACLHRQKMIEHLNLQGAGYTERHGKDKND